MSSPFPFFLFGLAGLSFPFRRIGWLLVLGLFHRALSQPVDVNTLPTKSLTFQSLGSNEGLSQGLVGNVVHDKDGFIWFATKDGLNRFDGYQMRIYRHQKEDPFSLPENHINSILEDPNGNFWIATSTNGLWRMDKVNGRFYKFPVTLEGETASGGLQFQNGCLWVKGRYNSVLLNVSEVYPIFGDPRTKLKWKIEFSTTWYPKLSSISQYFLLTSQGEIWQSNMEGIVYRAMAGPNGRWMVEKLQDALFSGVRFKGMPFLIEDPKSHLVWIFYQAQGWCFDPKTNKTIESIQCPEWEINSIRFQMVDGKLWYHDKHLNRIEFDFDRKSFTLIKSNLGSDVELQYCEIDRKGSKWFGSNGKGAFVIPYSHGRFHTHSEGKSIGFLYSGLNNQLIYRYSINRFFHEFFPEKDLESKIPYPGWATLLDGTENRISDPDYPGTFWQNLNNVVLTRFDFRYKEVERIDLSAYEEKIQNSIFHYISHIDTDRHLWRTSGNNSGKRFLTEVDLRTGKMLGSYPFPITSDFHEYPFVSHVLYDDQKYIWFATTQGLFCFDTQTKKWVKHYRFEKNQPYGISANILFSICPDPKEPRRYLWLGTNGGGLNKLDIQTGKCLVFDEKDGLPNPVVYGVLADEYQNLWLSTNRGLCCFTPPSKAGDKPRTRNFTKEDGLAGDEFNRYSYARLSNGILAFGGVDGITWFRPAEVLRKVPPPIIALTSFSVYNQEVDPAKDSLIMKHPLPFADEVHLDHHMDMFRIEFTCLGFEPNSKKRYRYFLEGWDKNWVEGGNNHFATYTNLDPGTYTFFVKGKVDEDWSQPCKGLKIIISPAWWETWWFRTLAILLFSGLLFAVYRYRLNQQLKLLRLRDKIALDLHDEIGSTLNSIAFYGEAAQMLIPAENRATDILGKINTQTREMIDSMSDIVWSLNTRNDSFSQMLNRLQSFTVGLMEPMGCRVEFVIPDNADQLKLDMAQRKNLYLLAKEAINNAAKYAHCLNLQISLTTKQGGFTLEIRDDGKGFDPAGVHQGNGLYNMQKRANELGASLSLDSMPGKGTRIIVHLK